MLRFSKKYEGLMKIIFDIKSINFFVRFSKGYIKVY